MAAVGTNGTNYTDAKGSATIVLTDNAGTPNTDTVTITAGTNIKIDNTGVGGFTINAQDTTTNNLYKLEIDRRFLLNDVMGVKKDAYDKISASLGIKDK